MAEKPKPRKKARPAVGTELRWISWTESPENRPFIENRQKQLRGMLTVNAIVEVPAHEYGFLIEVAHNGIPTTNTFSPFWFHYDGEYDTP